MSVYYITLTGDNSNDGLSIGNAWRDFNPVNKVASVVVAGDTVYVKTGDYTGQAGTDGYANPRNAGTFGSRITIWGDKNGIIFGGAGGDAIVTGHDDSSGGSPSYITFVGLKFTNTISCVHNELGIIAKACEINLRFNSNGNFKLISCVIGKGQTTNTTVIDFTLYLSLEAEIYNCTIYSSTNSGTSADMIKEIPTGGAPVSNFIKFYNNILIRRNNRYVFNFDIPIEADWNANWFWDYNFYQYENQVFDLGTIFIDTPIQTFNVQTLEDLQNGINNILPKDILGQKGDPFLDPDGIHLLTNSPCYNTALEIADVNVDIDLGPRNVFFVSDRGADEIKPDSADYTYYGFTSVVYPTWTDGAGNPERCTIVLDAFPDIADNVRVKVSFNGGSSWLTLVDALEGISYVGKTFPIPAPDRGSSLQFRLEIGVYIGNATKGDVGTNFNVDTETFNEDIIREQFPPGTELDVFDLGGNLMAKLTSGSIRQYKVFLPPGSYTVRAKGGGFFGERIRQITLGHSSWFGRYAFRVSEIWKQFYRSRGLATFNGVNWTTFACEDTFDDQTRRTLPDSYYGSNLLVVREGKLLKSHSAIDYIMLMTDPSVIQGL